MTFSKLLTFLKSVEAASTAFVTAIHSTTRVVRQLTRRLKRTSVSEWVTGLKSRFS